MGAIFFILTTALSVGAFVVGFVAGRSSEKNTALCAGAALGLILAKAFLHAKPSLEARLFPWVGYVYFQSYWLYPLGMLFFGVAISQLPVKWNRVVVAGIAFCFFGYSLWAERWMVLPTDDSSVQTATSDHHCRQTTSYTCVPAACVTLLSYWGVSATEGEMTRLCRTRGDGTTTFNAFRGVKLKLRATDMRAAIVEMDLERFRKLRKPVLFCDRRGHATVMMYDQGDSVVIWDPLVSFRRLATLDSVRSSISGAGVVIRSEAD